MRILIGLIAVAACAQTVTLDESTIVNATPSRIGTNQTTSNYDGRQIFKNVWGWNNPGFEGTITQMNEPCVSGSGTTCVAYNAFDQIPNGWVTGKSIVATFFASATNATIIGQTATLTNNTTANQSTTGATFTFGTTISPSPTLDDYFRWVYQQDQTSTIAQWSKNSGTGTVAGDTSQTACGSGVQMMKVDTSAGGAQNTTIQNGTDGGPDTVNSSHIYRIINGTYTGKIWAKLISGTGTFTVQVRRNASGGFSTTDSFTATGSCTQFTFSHAYTETGSANSGNLIVTITQTGNGVVEYDDWDFRKSAGTISANTSVYVDEYYQSFLDARYDVDRFWDNQPGETLADWTNDEWGRHSACYQQTQASNYTACSSGNQGIYEFLLFCELMGVKTCWISLPTAWPSADYASLLDFINGSTGTTYGAKRSARGHAAVFAIPHIVFELGNETWNSQFVGENMAQLGASANSIASYGNWANTVFGVMKAAGSWNAAGMQTAIGCQFVSTDGCLNHTYPKISPTSRLDSVAVAGYVPAGGMSYNTVDGTTEYTGDAATAWATANTSGGYVKSFALAFPSQSILLYETNQNAQGGSATCNQLTTHDAAMYNGPMIVMQMLENMRIYNLLAQNIWDEGQGLNSVGSCTRIPLFGSTLEYGGAFSNLAGTSYWPRPQYLAAQIANTSIIGAEYSAVCTSCPTYNSSVVNGNSAQTSVPYVFAYAFKTGSLRSLILINTSLSTQAITLAGNNVPTSVTQRLLSAASITANNETATAGVTLATSTVAITAGAYTIPVGMAALDWTVSTPSTSAYTIGVRITFGGGVIQ